MNRPTESKFMGHSYSLEFAPPDSIKNDDEGECYGLTNHVAQTIQVEDKLKPAKEREILLHELLHQVLHHAGLRWLTDGREEAIVMFLGNALGAHIEDNQQFWKYVTRPHARVPRANRKQSSASGLIPEKEKAGET